MKTNIKFNVGLIFLILALFSSSLLAETYMRPLGSDKTQVWWYRISYMGDKDLIHWADMDVDWYFNDDIPYYLSENQTRSEVQTSFNSWENVTTSDIDFTYKYDTSRTWANDGYNVFYWTYEDDDGAYEDIGFDGSIYAMTVITFNSSEEFLDVDIILNGEDITWSTDGTPSGGEIDVRAVATHEAGHLCGLGHSGTSGATMHAGYDFGQRTLHQDDRVGASFLYRGNIIENETIYDAYFEWPITVLSGATLTIEDGWVKFLNNSYLTINDNAALDIDIEWDDDLVIDFGYISTSHQIKIKEGGSASIKNAEIKYAYMAINADEPDLLDIRECKIHNCNYGIYILNANSSPAEPEIHDNEIYDNTYGLHFYNSGGDVTYNEIEDNDNFGVVCMMYSNPVFRNNSIAFNGGYEMYQLIGTTVDAEYNYWGTTRPDLDEENLFYGNVDYVPWLTSAP